MIFKSDLFLVLMFHKISKADRDGLTITIEDFIQYVDFFKRRRFHFLTAEDVVGILENKMQKPKVPSVFITFDDGYEETFKLIEVNYNRLEVPMTCFVPVKHVGGFNEWDQKKEALLNWSEISALAEKNITDFALHSYAHQNYRDLSLDEIKKDIENCKQHWQARKYFSGLLAYPFGAFNKKEMSPVAETLKKEGIVGAFRIGNRRNYWKSLNPHFIERIDIRGDQSFFRNLLRICGFRL